MEAARDKARRLGAITSNPQFPYLLGCCCLLMILFVVAMVVVMALIPTYLPNNSVPLTSNSSTLARTSIAAASSTTSSGRKRDATAFSSLAECSDAEFGPLGREMIRQKFRKYFQKSRIVSDFQIVSVTLGILDSSSKKRFALDRSPRQASQYVYDVLYYVFYKPGCYYSCQLNGGSTIQNTLYSIPVDDLTFSNVDLYRNGVNIGYLPVLRSLGISYVSSIFPGLGPFKPGKGPNTRRITTTTAATTPALNG